MGWFKRICYELQSKTGINNGKLQKLVAHRKAFRMSKTDLRIRPIYHRLRKRIEAHICLSFVAYTIYKELERVLKMEKYPLSVEKAAELTHNMYQMEIILPESLHCTKNPCKNG